MPEPILAAQNTWFAPTVSSVTRASITEIEIMDSYTPTGTVTDSWDASAAKDGSVTCYVIGTKLIIAGNGSGKVYANEDSGSCFAAFSKVKKIIVTNALSLSKTVNANGFFVNCPSLTTIEGLAGLDVSNVTDMGTMFAYCSSLTSVGDLSNWNVSKVARMTGMFCLCSSLTSVGDLSNWNVSEVTSTQTMFTFCSKMVSIGDLSNWDVSKVESMNGMFSSCPKLTSIGDLSGWDVSNLTDASALFDGCSSLTTIGDLSNWNVSKVTTMRNMFDECSKLTSVGNLSNWDTSSCTEMSFMFYSCSSLGEINVSNWNTAKVTTLDHFAAHANLKRIGMGNWNTSSLVNANAAFHNCAEEELDLSGWDVSKVQFFCQMFENSPNLKRVKGLENWNTSAGLGFDGMFERCGNLEELDLSSFNTRNAKNGISASGSNNHVTATLNNMFLSCNKLVKVKVGANWSVNGDGTNTTAANKAILPTPSATYIPGADGYWYTFNGDQYAPNAMQDRTAATYYGSFDIVAEEDAIVKNGSLIDTAKAIRYISKGSEKYLPSEFGNAIRNLAVSLAVDSDGNATLVNAILSVDESGNGTIGV